MFNSNQIITEKTHAKRNVLIITLLITLIAYALKKTLFFKKTPRKEGDPLKILQVGTRFYPYMGGVETHMYEVSRRMVQEGHDVTVLSTDVEGNLDSEDCVEGVKVVRVPAYPKGKDYYFAPSIFTYIMKNRDWDVIHCQGFHTLVPPLVMLAAILTKTPFVFSFHSGGHSSSFRNGLRDIQSAILRPLLLFSAKLVAVSNFEAALFQDRLKLPDEKFTVISNGAKLPKFEPLTTDDADTLTVLSVGRLEKYKGHHRLIEAFPQVIKEIPNARLRILGKGTYADELHKLVQENNLESFVTITHIPPKERSQMAEELVYSSLFVLFSEYEANPIAVLEAVAMQCSILVADTSGLSELAQQGLGNSIAIDSSKADIAMAIIHQLKNPYYPPTIDLPSWEGCTESLLQIYADVSYSY